MCSEIRVRHELVKFKIRYRISTMNGSQCHVRIVNTVIKTMFGMTLKNTEKENTYMVTIDIPTHSYCTYCHFIPYSEWLVCRHGF